MSTSWFNETALDVVAGLASNATAKPCTLSTGQMLAIAAFGDGESDKKKHRFIEDDASDGTMIARQVSPRLESCRATTRKAVFQEVVDVHRSRSPSITSFHSPFNPLHRSVSLDDFRQPLVKIALSSFSLDCVQTEEVPRILRDELFPIR